MFKSDGINYDNVRPKANLLSSKKINFHDKKDLIKNVEKEKNILFSKKSNLIFFLLCISFSLFISFNILKVTYNKEINSSTVQEKIKINRGKILDRNNEIIATSIDTKDLYVDIKKSLDKEKLKNVLSQIFEDKESAFFERIFNKEQYSLIKKDISPTEINKLRSVGDPAIKLHESKKRVYPQHNIFSNLIGIKTNELISKIEKNMNKELVEGKNLKLTVDLRIQNIVREELYKSLIEYKAKAALAVVMNVKSGEIFSMVSLPDFNPNYPKSILPKTENNLNAEARYEMGSTLKIFNAAMVYESESEIQFNEFEIYDGYQITNEKHILDDHIDEKILNFDDVFVKSSNIGSVKILESFGPNKQKQFFKKVGLTEKLHIKGLNVVSNKLPINWESHSKFISYGYGLSLSPISLITAFASLVNGGYKIQPSLIKNRINQKEVKVFSSETSKKINELIHKIVMDGTGKQAQVKGLLIGGKTGTSKKVENGNYSEKKKITSFIGIFPANSPEFLTFVLFDEPTKNVANSKETTGGNTAAPTFSKIVKKISPIITKDNYSRN